MFEISKLCFSHPQKSKSFVESHHFIPVALHKKLLGEAIFLIQIRFPTDFNKDFLNVAKELSEIIINGLKTNYYTPENFKDSDDLEMLFENTLQKVNRLIFQEVIGSKIIEKLVQNLDAIVAIIKEEKIYFSPVGFVQASILRKDKIVHLFQPQKRSHQMPLKIFTQIISGGLEKEDVLIFSTDNFLDYFNFEKLKNNILKYPADLAIKNLEKILENLKEEISLGFFLIKREKEKILEVKPEILPEKKMAKKEIAPTKIFVESLGEEAKEVFIKGEKKEEKIVFQKPEKKGGKLKLKLPKFSFSFLPLRKFFSIFKGIPRPTIKIKPSFLIIITLFAFLIILNLFQLKGKNTISPQFFLPFQEIQEKSILLKASSLYGDEKRALLIAREIEEKINFLQPKSKIEKEIFENLKKNFEENLKDLYKIEKIKEPKVIVNFSSLDRNGEFRNFTLLDNKFFIFNERTKEIYEFNQKTNETSSLLKADFVIKRIIGYTDNKLLINGENKIYLIDPKQKKVSPLKLETKQGELSINDLEIYENRLYFLDQKKNQIFRYLKLDDAFGQEINWLKEKIDLKNIVSFAIDGSIYLLKEDGEILKFYLGKKIKFDQEKVYPEIKTALQIFTKPDFKFIYLLEPENKRIIIFDKNGKLVKQITSEKFNNLKNLFIDTKERKIWLLNDSQIIEVNL